MSSSTRNGSTPRCPRRSANAKILLLNAAVEFKKTEVDAEINITAPDQLQAFLDEEERMVKSIVDKIVKSGANVLFCQKGIDDIAQHYLAKAGIFAARRVKKSDMEKLARATGAPSSPPSTRSARKNSERPALSRSARSAAKR